MRKLAWKTFRCAWSACATSHRQRSVRPTLIQSDWRFRKESTALWSDLSRLAKMRHWQLDISKWAYLSDLRTIGGDVQNQRELDGIVHLRGVSAAECLCLKWKLHVEHMEDTHLLETLQVQRQNRRQRIQQIFLLSTDSLDPLACLLVHWFATLLASIGIVSVQRVEVGWNGSWHTRSTSLLNPRIMKDHNRKCYLEFRQQTTAERRPNWCWSRWRLLLKQTDWMVWVRKRYRLPNCQTHGPSPRLRPLRSPWFVRWK